MGGSWGQADWRRPAPSCHLAGGQATAPQDLWLYWARPWTSPMVGRVWRGPGGPLVLPQGLTLLVGPPSALPCSLSRVATGLPRQEEALQGEDRPARDPGLGPSRVAELRPHPSPLPGA